MHFHINCFTSVPYVSTVLKALLLSSYLSFFYNLSGNLILSDVDWNLLHFKYDICLLLHAHLTFLST